MLDSLVASGHGEWEDAGKTRCRIFWKTPQEWASLMYKYAEQNDMLGSVVTIYELHSGEDVEGQPFAGLDEGTVMAALRVLEGEGKAQVFTGATSDDAGVKFFK